MGSASEVEYFVLLARDLEFLEPERAESLTADTTEIKRMLASLIAHLKADS
jgi:four helix bundle protein